MNFLGGYNFGEGVFAGDSGGPIFIVGSDGRPRFAGVISSKFTDPELQDAVGLAGSGRALDFVQDAVASLPRQHDSGAVASRP